MLVSIKACCWAFFGFDHMESYNDFLFFTVGGGGGRV